MQKILILGATSAIATATARILVSAGHALFLAARNESTLRALADDLRTRGSQTVETTTFDATAIGTHKDLVNSAAVALGGLDTAILAYGSLPDQIAIQGVPERVIAELETNFTSVASLLTILAAQFERQGHGTIVAISSVAGDRGRAVNYVYGSAKAGLTCFLSGLRQRLWRKGVEVITIKPALVNTPMTAGFRKGALWTTPEAVAIGIVRAIEARKAVVYLPGFWRLIMAGIRLLPERFFMRLRF
jgi:decaprenylphospho-beta-D-erythro-pentofuranosid-2-ulose 2-reductase